MEVEGEGDYIHIANQNDFGIKVGSQFRQEGAGGGGGGGGGVSK